VRRCLLLAHSDLLRSHEAIGPGRGSVRRDSMAPAERGCSKTEVIRNFEVIQVDPSGCGT
jgi:hypothetical protein